MDSRGLKNENIVANKVDKNVMQRMAVKMTDCMVYGEKAKNVIHAEKIHQ